MSSRLIDLTRELSELQAILNSIPKEFKSDDINSLQVVRYSEKASYMSYCPVDIERYTELLVEKSAELECIKQDKAILESNYNSALELLKSSGFKHSSVKNAVFKHSLRQGDSEVFICTDEYDILTEMSLCLFYLGKLGIDIASSVQVSNDLISRYATPSGNAFLVEISKDLGVSDIDSSIDFKTLVSTVTSILERSSDEILDDIVAGALSDVKSNSDSKISDFIKAFLKNKYKQVSRYARTNGLVEPSKPTDAMLDSEFKSLIKYFTHDIDNIATLVSPTTEELSILLSKGVQ